jgi:hypothetical protein
MIGRIRRTHGSPRKLYGGVGSPPPTRPPIRVPRLDGLTALWRDGSAATDPWRRNTLQLGIRSAGEARANSRGGTGRGNL